MTIEDIGCGLNTILHDFAVMTLLSHLISLIHSLSLDAYLYLLIKYSVNKRRESRKPHTKNPREDKLLVVTMRRVTFPFFWSPSGNCLRRRDVSRFAAAQSFHFTELKRRLCSAALDCYIDVVCVCCVHVHIYF